MGCTVVELLDGKPPYHKLASMQALFRIVNDDHPPLPEGASPVSFDTSHNPSIYANSLSRQFEISLCNAFRKILTSEYRPASFSNIPGLLMQKDQIPWCVLQRQNMMRRSRAYNNGTQLCNLQMRRDRVDPHPI